MPRRRLPPCLLDGGRGTALNTVSRSSMIPVPYWASGTMLPIPATSSTTCIGSWYCRSNARQRGSLLASANLLGPYCSRRDASSDVSPRAGSTSIEAATASPGSSYHAVSAGGVGAFGAAVIVPWRQLSRAAPPPASYRAAERGAPPIRGSAHQ